MDARFSTTIGIAAALFALRWCVGHWGINAFWAWCAACGGGLAITGAGYFVMRWRLKQLRRQLCDDRILYATRKRQAFDRPDFGIDEMIEMRRLRRTGDFEALGRYLAASDAIIRAKETT